MSRGASPLLESLGAREIQSIVWTLVLVPCCINLSQNRNNYGSGSPKRVLVQYQAEKDMLQVAVQVKIPRLDTSHIPAPGRKNRETVIGPLVL